MPTDIFSGLSIQSVQTSAGPAEVPVRYFDGSMLGMMYGVDVSVAARFVAQTPLEPLPILGKALVSLVCFEYRDASIGPYNELGIAIQCRRRGTRPSVIGMATDLSSQRDVGQYWVNLPVTSDIGRAVGVDVWGYPKYVTGIATSFGSRDVEITLADELRIRHRRPWIAPKIPGTPFITFTEHRLRLLRTVATIGNSARWGGARSVRVEPFGAGPTERTVRTLGLDQKTPWFAFRSDAIRAVLPAGEDLGPTVAWDQDLP